MLIMKCVGKQMETFKCNFIQKAVSFVKMENEEINVGDFFYLCFMRVYSYYIYFELMDLNNRIKSL